MAFRRRSPAHLPSLYSAHYFPATVRVTAPGSACAARICHLSPPAPPHRRRPVPDVLIVGTLDGNIHGVAPDTGTLLWTFQSGTPLLTSRKATDTGSQVNIFPGADGGLYAYHGLQEHNVGLEVRL